MEPRATRRTRTPINKAIGKRVRHLRMSQDLRQEDLARAAGVSFAVISRLEHGKQSVSLERAHDIALALGVTLNDLFPREEKP